MVILEAPPPPPPATHTHSHTHIPQGVCWPACRTPFISTLPAGSAGDHWSWWSKLPSLLASSLTGLLASIVVSTPHHSQGVLFITQISSHHFPIDKDFLNLPCPPADSDLIPSHFLLLCWGWPCCSGACQAHGVLPVRCPFCLECLSLWFCVAFPLFIHR